MGAEGNLETVRALYQAFARGDVDLIVEHVTDDVDWAADTRSRAAPWYGAHHGKAGVIEFFEAFGSAMTVQELELLSCAANEDDVLAVVRIRSTRTRNGRATEMNLHHWFQLRDGKIAYFRGTEDTAQVEHFFGR